mgnify:FL=1
MGDQEKWFDNFYYYYINDIGGFCTERGQYHSNYYVIWFILLIGVLMYLV